MHSQAPLNGMKNAKIYGNVSEPEHEPAVQVTIEVSIAEDQIP